MICLLVRSGAFMPDQPFHFRVAISADITSFKAISAHPTKRQFLPMVSEVSPEVLKTRTVPNIAELLPGQGAQGTFFKRPQTGTNRSVPMDGGAVPKVSARISGSAHRSCILIGIRRYTVFDFAGRVLALRSSRALVAAMSRMIFYQHQQVDSQ